MPLESHRSISSQNHPVGVLLINLGTPDSPTPAAVKRYLKEFLWDPRLIDMFRPLWWLILNGIILNTRPRRSAMAYAKIWTSEGSPLLAISKQQATAIEAELNLNRDATMLHVSLGMRYGLPSIQKALEELRQKGCNRFILVPLYPQYSGTTTASAFDAVAEVFRSWKANWNKNTDWIQVNNYYDNKNYINELAKSVQEQWERDGEPDKLIMSFHGMPARYIDAGDPYKDQCEKTAELLASRLGLPTRKWLITFQSRFGRQKWIRPYTDKTLKELAQSGNKKVDVICPGFSADCLETLEEIKIQNRNLFLEAGGERYRYIPALNVRPGFIKAISEICDNKLQESGWIKSHKINKTSRI